MKKTFTKLSLTCSALVLATTALVAVPVLAEDGGSTTTTTSSSSSGSSGEASVESTGSIVHETVQPVGTSKPETETEQEANAQHQGELMLTQLRHTNKQHTDAERKTACEAHKQGLSNKFKSINTEMAAFNTRIDDILAKAQAYQSKNNVTVANWTDLVAKATAADTTSDASIAALKALTPSVDCNNTSVAQDVATFKAAAQQASTDLKAYKAAAHAMVSALLAVTQPADTANKGGQQ